MESNGGGGSFQASLPTSKTGRFLKYLWEEGCSRFKRYRAERSKLLSVVRKSVAGM